MKAHLIALALPEKKYSSRDQCHTGVRASLVIVLFNRTNFVSNANNPAIVRYSELKLDIYLCCSQVGPSL